MKIIIFFMRSIALKGKIQAVSEDGLVVVTMDSAQKVYVYFLGPSIWYKQLDLPSGFTPPERVQKYLEENTPFYSFHPVLFGTRILVFMIDKDKRLVFKASMLSSESSTVTFESQTFSEVLDIAVHPSEGCLIVLTKTSLQLMFRESANYSASLPTSPSLVKSGKLKVIQDEGNVYYFTFVTENHDDTEIHIHKLMEINYSTNTFSAVLSNYIQITSHLFDHELFSGINYDESTKIFGIHNDYSYGKSMARVNHFVNWDLNYQLYSHDSNVPYHFYDFVKNTDKLLMADLWEGNGFFYVRGICTVPYSVLKYTIETHLEEEECMEGGLEFDRAGTWVDEKGAIYIISEKDNQITLYDSEGFDVVSSFQGHSISLHQQGKLIFATDDQIRISTSLSDFQDKDTTVDDDDNDNGINDNDQSIEETNNQANNLSFGIGLGIGIGISLMIIIAIVIFYWIKRKSAANRAHRANRANPPNPPNRENPPNPPNQQESRYRIYQNEENSRREREEIEEIEQIQQIQQIEQIQIEQYIRIQHERINYFLARHREEEMRREREQRQRREERAVCPICLDHEPDFNCKLPCEHTFHFDCIQPQLVNNRKCPYCRRPFSVEDVIRL